MLRRGIQEVDARLLAPTSLFYRQTFVHLYPNQIQTMGRRAPQDKEHEERDDEDEHRYPPPRHEGRGRQMTRSTALSVVCGGRPLHLPPLPELVFKYLADTATPKAHTERYDPNGTSLDFWASKFLGLRVHFTFQATIGDSCTLVRADTSREHSVRVKVLGLQSERQNHKDNTLHDK